MCFVYRSTSMLSLLFMSNTGGHVCVSGLLNVAYMPKKKKKVKVRTDLPGSMAQLLLFWTQLLEANNNELHGLAWRCPWPCWAWVNRMLDYLVKRWCWASSHLCCACTWLSGTVLTPQVLPLFAFCFLSHTPYSASVPRSWAKQNQGLLFILSCPLLFLCLFLLFSLLGECVLGIEPRTLCTPGKYFTTKLHSQPSMRLSRLKMVR